MIKEHLWEFLERQGFKRGAVETYGENRALSTGHPMGWLYEPGTPSGSLESRLI